ncbi:MAG TPA: DinB family protein [Actinomycetota bacterium]|nr:DinB family protein [Actinomycetota bacterium]
MLREAFGHHAWATRQLLDHCSSLPTELLDRPVDATYGSILDTFRHLVDADASYLHRISGGDLGEMVDDDRALSFDDVVALHERNAAGWETVLERGADPDAAIVHERSDGTVRRATAGVRLAQALHHGSDHRSQISTALTLLGHPAGEFDVWTWGEAVGLASVSPRTSGTSSPR